MARSRPARATGDLSQKPTHDRHRGAIVKKVNGEIIKYDNILYVFGQMVHSEDDSVRVLPDDQAVSSTHKVWLTAICNLSSRKSDALF